MEKTWIDWIVELQSIAQIGLAYSKDVYDIERFERIREITAEMISKQSNLPLETVKNLFCNETGYQTPKMDTRAAVFQENKILLVKEHTTWSLPGGWIDINESVKSNTIKEVKEEAGLDVMPVKIIAIQDRNKHNKPQYVYGVCKVFVLCDIVSGAFKPNVETSESGFFALDDLPDLANAKNTIEQINMCFEAYYNNNWIVQFD
ncbi:MAG: NUDIX hydrolase [Defluviitaleaceae bacterium]|nr:NUDIX hydrolase [Defluviitaleaceae bacterium]